MDVSYQVCAEPTLSWMSLLHVFGLIVLTFCDFFSIIIDVT